MQILQIVVRLAELGDGSVELLVDGLELFVDRLQLFPGCLEFLDGRLELLVRGQQLLVARVQILGGRAEPKVRAFQLFLETLDKMCLVVGGERRACGRALGRRRRLFSSEALDHDQIVRK